MNKDQFEGKWKQFKGKVKEKWGKLTDNDLTRINGNYDQFIGSLQELYGYSKEQAEKYFKKWNWGNIVEDEEDEFSEDKRHERKN